MPIVVMHTVYSHDVLDNKNCLFVYMDHSKQKGDPLVNIVLRDGSNSAPILVKKFSGREPESYYKDNEFHVFKEEFDKSWSVVNNYLADGGVAMLCRESVDSQDFSMINIKRHSTKVHDYIEKHMTNLLKRYK